jgi:SAM-dependent methyltransferase
VSQVTTHSRWSGDAAAYARTFAGQCAHTVVPLLDGLGAAPGVRLLDVGTGAGAVAVSAASRGCAVTGVDPEEDMLSLASAAAPGVTLVRAALPRLPFAAGAFDAVSANFVLNHVSDPRGAASELARVAAPGGRVGVTVWPSAPCPLRTLWDEVVQEAGVTVPDTAGDLPADLDFERTAAGLAGLLAGAGLTVRQAWHHTFVHVVEPEVWWSGATAGVARIGKIYLAQDEDGRTAMAAAFRRRSDQYREKDGLLHLAGMAVVAIAGRE